MQHDINKKTPEFENILSNGHALLNGTDPGSERDALESRLADTEKRWDEVKTAAENRTNGIDVLLPESEKYSDNSVTFSCWLMTAETKEKDLQGRPLSSDRAMLDQQRREIEVFEALTLYCFYTTVTTSQSHRKLKARALAEAQSLLV